ncbi:MAG: ECF transporter S component [Candidatus Thorarchaeota archaeon]|nr:ECF transporter S component [Candidatus Thorarchaeota archaeon]MCK5389175.1 ECF transporter S component [Candidatus Thorarchaeota archaeon]
MEAYKPYHESNKSRWVAVTAIMSALALVGNYVLVAIPNVELGSGVLFVTAYLFGLGMGIWCVLIVSIIYAFFNPWGPFIPTIWITQLIGWIFMVIAGMLMGRKDSNKSWTRGMQIELGIVGAVVTLFFDLITTLGYSIWFGVPYFIAVITGSTFIVLHVVSNAIIFPAIVPKLDVTMKQQLNTLFNGKQSLS